MCLPRVANPLCLMKPALPHLSPHRSLCVSSPLSSSVASRHLLSFRQIPLLSPPLPSSPPACPASRFFVIISSAVMSFYSPIVPRVPTLLVFVPSCACFLPLLLSSVCSPHLIPPSLHLTFLLLLADASSAAPRWAAGDLPRCCRTSGCLCCR